MGRIDKDFDLFIFDEFHVFAAPQIASVINTMLLIRCTNRRNKFLFLSATPDTNLIERLEKAGFRCKEIDPLKQNKYQFPDTSEEGQQVQIQGWRQVARTIRLNFIPNDFRGYYRRWGAVQSFWLFYHFINSLLGIETSKNKPSAYF